MEKMIGFRGADGATVDEYQELNLDILKGILKTNLKDLEDFYTAIVKYFQLDR